MDIEKYTSTTIIPSRSKFQLRQFVIGQHDTAPMQWRQILIEAQDLIYKIRSAEISLAKNEIEKNRLLDSSDPSDILDAEQKDLDIAITKLALAGARLELDWLKSMADKIGVYSFEQIEEDQPTYWEKRLARQANIDMLSIQKGISAGNIESMLNAGLISYEEAQCAISNGD